MQACGCNITTARYAVYAPQLPLFLQGDPQRKPWLLLAGFGWLLALAIKKRGLVGLLLAGFLAGFWLAFWLVWLAFWLASGWLSGWFGWLSGWLLAGFLAGFLFFPVILARLAETQLRGILQSYLGVVMLQPHACTQRCRFRILRRTRSFPDGRVPGACQVE